MKPSTMFRTICALLLTAGLFMAPAVWAEDEEEPAVVLKGYDPVKLIDEEEVKGNEEIYADHDKNRYLFVSEENKAKFEADTDAYAIQGDGSCPVAPVHRADNDLFVVYKEKIYTFTSLQCIDDFNADPERYLDPKHKEASMKEHMEAMSRRHKKHGGDGR